MAIFRAYAKVLEPGDPTMRIYETGLRTCPGQLGLLLADVLRRTGGVYETTTPLPPQLRDDIREAGLPADLHFHDLRHTGNTLTAEAGASLAPLTGSGWREHSYGGFGRGHPHFHPHAAPPGNTRIERQTEGLSSWARGIRRRAGPPFPARCPSMAPCPPPPGHLAEPAGVTVAHRRPQREAPAREPGLARRDHGSGCYSSCRTALSDSGSVVTPSGRRIGEVSLNPFTMQ